MENKSSNDNSLEILQTMKSLVEDVQFIKEYILLQNRNNYGIERCLEILKEKKYITTSDIENDVYLKTKYHQRDKQNKLLSDLLAENVKLKEIRIGKGGKRYVFHKVDEDYVRSQIRINKFKNKKTSSIRREYEDIKLNFQSYNNSSISVKKAHEILRIEFNIKDIHKRRQILKDLNTDNVIKNIQNNRFILQEV